MSKVKYRVREFTPKSPNLGSHSWFAEVVINNDVDNDELAKKIAARTGFKSYECQAVIAAIADIVSEEALQSNRVSLTNDQGTKLVSIYPRVSGSISDTDVQRNPDKYPGKTVAEESMLTPDMLTWTLGASVGIKFSQEFALHKQAQKVKTVSADVPSSTHAITLGQTTDSTGGDDVTLTGAGTYDAGDTVSVQAEYDGPSGTNFDGWYDAASGGTKVSSNETYTFTMPDEDVALYAKYTS